jgi:enoyl-CoA hydratase/carnithine racemase
MSAAIRLEITPPLARICLCREHIDASTVDELYSACEALSSEASVRVVVLGAEGSTFCRGWAGDILTSGAATDPFRCLSTLAKPVVCATNGEAASGGLELALACDIRIAGEDARFSLPELSMGLLPMAGGLQRLARAVGRGKALEIALTGAEVDADEALRIGLVSAVVPSDKLAAEAEAIAARIAERGPIATGYAKEAVARGIDMPLEEALRMETDLTIILQTTEDRAEGVRAFLDKRKPEFKGK